MNILFPIGAFYPSQNGGPCNTLYWHTCELTRNNINVKIVTTTSGIKKGEVESDITHTAKCGNVYYGDNSTLNLKIFWQIIKSIKKVDIVHLNSLFSMFSIFTFFYIKFFFKNKAVMWSVRGELSRNALEFSKWKKKPLLFFYKHLSKNVVFHCTSELEQDDIMAVFEKANVINLPNFIQPADRVEHLSVKKQLLFIGRIHPIKALDKLIIALSLCDSFLNSDFKLIIAGKCEDRHQKYYESLISLSKENGLMDKIIFMGHVEGKGKEELFAESYFSILPSESENFGNVIVESLNQGTPVIASLGTPWSMLNSENCGFHVSNFPADLSKVIEEVVKMPSSKYNEFRINSCRLIENNFAIDKQIFRWIKEYKSLYNV